MLTSIFGFLSFNIAKEVAGNISENRKKNESVNNSKELWFKNFKESDIKKNPVILQKIKAPYVLINFWASWCKPCLQEFPELIKLRKQIPEEKLYVVGINCDEETPLKKVLSTQSKFQFNFPNIVDPENKNLTAIGSMTLPATLLFYKGELIYSSYKRTNFQSEEFLNLLKK